MLDLKVHKPENFHGRRDEPWKVWSRQFKTYCNAIRTGFRKALEWSENFEGECIDESAIDSMGWPQARLADEKLYDFLVMICKGDALVIVETYDGLGFEAWRQLHKRYAPSGGRYELEMMSRIMNPTKVGRIQDLPGAILRFERDVRTYEARTGRQFPLEWKTPTFLKLLPDSHRDELERRYMMGTRDYETLVASVRGFSQEAWFNQKGPSDMDVDMIEPNSTSIDEIARRSTFDEFVSIWAGQHPEEQAVDYMGPKGGKGKGKGWQQRQQQQRQASQATTTTTTTAKAANQQEETRRCRWCKKRGHLVRDCPERKAGKPKTGVGSLEYEGDYHEAITDAECGGLDFSLSMCEKCCDGDGGDAYIPAYTMLNTCMTTAH